MRMLLLDKYYQVIEKKTHLVSLCWKVYHSVSLFGAVVFSIMAAVFFRKLQESFGHQCILNAKLTFKENSECYPYTGAYNGSSSFHNPHTTWGPAADCGYCEYCYLLVGIIGMIMFAFVVILPRGGSEVSEIYTRSWRIVLPFIILATVITIFVFTAYIKEKIGIDNFCKQFETSLNKTTCGEEINQYTLIYNTKTIDANHYINRSLIFANLSFIFWAILLLTLVFRLIRGADFHLIVYQLDNIKAIDADATLTDSIESLNQVQAELDMDYERDVISIKSSNTLPITRV